MNRQAYFFQVLIVFGTLFIAGLSCSGLLFAQQTTDNGAAETPDNSVPQLRAVPESGSVADYNSYIAEVQFYRYAAPDEASYNRFVVEQSKAMVAAADKILQHPDVLETEALSAANLKFERQQVLCMDKPEEFIAQMDKLVDRLQALNFNTAAQTCSDRLLGWEFQLAVSNQNLPLFNKTVEKLDKWLEEQKEDLTLEQVRLVQSICQISEYLAGAKLQPILFEKYGKRLAQSSDGAIAHIGRSMLGAKRRWELPGKTLTIKGKLLDGTDFDFASLTQGKVVLVEFWATWCGPCCGEIPHLKRMYEKYHDRGFEIVAISLDRDLNELVRFVKEREVPWPQLPAFDTQAEDQTLTEYYGISSIPMLFLLDRAGKVVSIEARGPVLERLLAEQFPEESAKEPATEPANAQEKQ